MIYAINKNDNKDQLEVVKRITLQQIDWKEEDLENLIAKNIQELFSEDQLMVLMQENKFQEHADILALDEKGNLYIFELKRWGSHQENILQVLRYGQIFGQYNYEKLNRLYSNYKKQNISLMKAHYNYFNEILSQPLNEKDFNRNQNFIVITDGADLETLNAIKYWKDLGIKIESLPFRVFDVNGTYLFEFNKYNPKNDILLDINTNSHIVNTNIAWSNVHYKEMLENNKASAYYDKKSMIKGIKKGDEVFLYHSGVGIIAYGKATSNYQIKEIDGKLGEEYYVTVNYKWKIDPDNEKDKAVKAWEINSALKSSHRFRGTRFGISSEMAREIKNIVKQKIKIGCDEQ